MRQWVLSVPFPLRYLFASQPKVMGKVLSIVYRPAESLDQGDGAPQDLTIKHNVYQWDTVWSNNDFIKGGWAGQGLLINPERDLVAVWTGYFKDDKQSEVELLPILRTVLEGVFGLNSGN
jgi:hypothetical protein